MSKNKKRTVRTLISLTLFALTLIIFSVTGEERWFIEALAFGVIYIIAGYDVLFKATRNILRGKVFDENFLMTVASLGALALGEYTEACAVMIFYQIGECFQAYAVGKSRRSISKLMDIRPDIARVIREGEEVEVEPDEVSLGELITVRAGDRIPLDGVVKEGSCHLNTSALTGESKPLSVSVGDEVLSGTVCLDGKLVIEVTKEFYDSAVSKILEMVEDASGKKAKVEGFISVFAKYYTPIVVVSAILLTVIPSIFTGLWRKWTVRALTFLVVSCPCALVISIPLGFFGGIGGAGNKGILVKGSGYIEQIDRANVFVFDKTGTLTKGQFEVVGVYPEKNRERVLRYAYLCEKNSNHPIAKSIVRAYGKDDDCVAEITEIAGKGLSARIENREILCGNKTLLEDNGVLISLNAGELGSFSEKTQTAVYIAINGQFLGVIALSDKVRDDAKETVDKLKERGAAVYMLTGDGKQIAQEVADKLGVEVCHGELLPQDKLLIVEEIIHKKNKNDVVCFVGDGINDAPVLVRADLGISMGGIGSDSAIEASDVVLMHDKLSSIITAKKIARKTMRIVRQNVVLALAVKFSALILSSFGIGGMWYAVFADVGVAMLAILNSMRTMIVKE